MKSYKLTISFHRHGKTTRIVKTVKASNSAGAWRSGLSYLPHIDGLIHHTISVKPLSV